MAGKTGKYLASYAVSAIGGGPMINFSNLKVRLGGTVILDGATAALPPGAKIGLIGRNDAGKSSRCGS